MDNIMIMKWKLYREEKFYVHFSIFSIICVPSYQIIYSFGIFAYH